MPRTTGTTPALRALLEAQDQVVSMQQLVAHGFGANAVQHRVGRHHWQRLLPGVVLAQPGEPSRRQRVIAASLWAGDDAAVDGSDACLWYGVRASWFRPEIVHVVVPGRSTLRSRRFVKVRRSLAAIDLGDRGAVPYVTKATAVVTAAREAPSVDAAISLLSRSLQVGLVTIEQLALAREAVGDKWCRRTDSALFAVGVGVRSPAEWLAHELIVASAVLPEPRWNQWIDLGDGGTPVCADALWEDAALVNEVLGKRYHAWGARFENTETRRARMVAAGLVMQGATATRLRQKGRLVVATLEQTYRRNTGRGMPVGVRLIDPPRAIAA